MPQTVKEKLSSLGIPLGAVARIAGCYPSDVSYYFIDPALLGDEKRAAIEKSIKDCFWIQEAARAHFPPAMVLNWKRPVAIKEFMKECAEKPHTIEYLVSVSEQFKDRVRLSDY